MATTLAGAAKKQLVLDGLFIVVEVVIMHADGVTNHRVFVECIELNDQTKDFLVGWCRRAALSGG